MAKVIHNLGDPRIQIGANESIKMNSVERLVIVTKHGQKFEIVVGENNLTVRTVTTMSTGIIVKPNQTNSVIIEEQED